MTTAIETTIPAKIEHEIPSVLLQKKVQVAVVGCGGTGSAIAAGLPYLHQAMVALGHPHGLDVTLVDGDRISRTNCVRQPFSESEIGLHKATVLATRINLFWGLGWKGVPHFMDESWGHETDILIGCVDTRAARNAMTRTPTYWNCHYWLDLGNNADSGQFVLGEPENQRNKVRDSRLPTAPELFPEPRQEGQTSAVQRGRSAGTAGAVREPDTRIPCAGDARPVVPIWAAFVPRRVREPANWPHNLPGCRPGSMAADADPAGRFRITQTQEK